jgi:protein-L-isoaspartate(D-aspartate) O-methyltransferase
MGSPQEMIREIKESYGLNTPEVFSAMLKVPREEFVPWKFRDMAYDDGPIFIGFGQTISQPYTVAFMTDLISTSLSTSSRKKILEIGTGFGYQAAVLSLLFDKVYTVERIPELAQEAKQRLKKLGYKNVEVKKGSGEFGWKEKSPFDAILVTAGMEAVPQEFFGQLKEGGNLVAPIGVGEEKQMTKYTKLKNGRTKEQKYGIFHFVPFVESN